MSLNLGFDTFAEYIWPSVGSMLWEGSPQPRLYAGKYALRAFVLTSLIFGVCSCAWVIAHAPYSLPNTILTYCVGEGCACALSFLHYKNQLKSATTTRYAITSRGVVIKYVETLLGGVRRMACAEIPVVELRPALDTGRNRIDLGLDKSIWPTQVRALESLEDVRAAYLVLQGILGPRQIVSTLRDLNPMERVLRSGETILWRGNPDEHYLWKRRVIYESVGTAITVGGMTLAVLVSLGKVTVYPGLVLIALMIGLAIPLGRLEAKRRSRVRTFAITNQRVIIHNKADLTSPLRDRELHQCFGWNTKKAWRSDVGAILFDKQEISVGHGTATQQFAFNAIPNVDQVAALIGNRAQIESKRASE